MVKNVYIESLAFGGEGVGHLSDGKVVFVPDAFPGEIIDVKIVKEKKSFTRGLIQNIIKPSPFRVDSFCCYAQEGFYKQKIIKNITFTKKRNNEQIDNSNNFFNKSLCGGCPWAQLIYNEQLKWKRISVIESLKRIAKIDETIVYKIVDDIIPSNKQWGYRNKIEYDVGVDSNGRFCLGMHKIGSCFIPIESCMLAPQGFEDVPKSLSGALKYVMNDNNDLGILRVGFRHSVRTHDTEIVLWTTANSFPRRTVAQVLSKATKANNPSITRVILKGKTFTRRVVGVESLVGKGFWTEKIYGHKMYISAPSFFQINTLSAESLIETVLEMLDINSNDRILDLYCGVGTFTLPLALYAKEVCAIESEKSSILDLKRNLSRYNLKAQVVHGDVSTKLNGLGFFDGIVVDPPRSGLTSLVIKSLAVLDATRLVYVSCNPSTLARDISVISKEGKYKLNRIVPVDMFPQTYHVETVALLSKIK